MSDTRDARPGAPRPPAGAGQRSLSPAQRPLPAGGAQSPRPPTVTPVAPLAVPGKPAPPKPSPLAVTAPRATAPSESDGGWEAADEVGSSAIIPAAAEQDGAAVPASPVARSEPKLEGVRAAGAETPRTMLAADPPVAQETAPVLPAEPESGPDLNGGAVIQSLPLEVQEQLFGVLRAALDASLRPVREKQQQLEEKLEHLRSEESMAHAAAKAAAAAAAAALARVAVSAAPPAPAPLAHPQTLGASTTPMRTRAPSFSIDITPSEPRIASVPPGSPSRRPSLQPTSYGYVITPEGGSRRPAIETALENLGPIDVPDFGNNRRLVGRVLVGLLLAGLAAAIVATILSYS